MELRLSLIASVILSRTYGAIPGEAPRTELKDFVAVTLLAFICLKCRAVFPCQSIVKTQTCFRQR